MGWQPPPCTTLPPARPIAPPSSSAPCFHSVFAPFSPQNRKTVAVKILKSFFLLGIQSGCSGQPWKWLSRLLHRAPAASFRLPPSLRGRAGAVLPWVKEQPQPRVARRLLLPLEGWRWAGLPAPPHWGGALRHRDLMPPLQLWLSVFGPGSGGVHCAPTCRGSLLLLVVITPQVHPESSCFSLAACGAFGTLLSPPPAGWMVWGAGRISPRPRAYSEPHVKDPPPSAVTPGTVPGDCPLRHIGLEWQNPGFGTLSNPAPLIGPQRWWLLGPLPIWDHIVDQNLKAHPCPLLFWALKVPELDGGRYNWKPVRGGRERDVFLPAQSSRMLGQW